MRKSLFSTLILGLWLFGLIQTAGATWSDTTTTDIGSNNVLTTLPVNPVQTAAIAAGTGFVSQSLLAADWNLLMGTKTDTASGLQINGGGYRIGAQVVSKKSYDFQGKELLVRWKANGGAGMNFMHPGIYIIGSDSSIANGYFTINHSWNGSKVISDNVWYYSHFMINSNMTYSIVTTTGNYNTNGGTMFHTVSGSIDAKEWSSLQNGQIFLQVWDNYGGTGAYLVVGEILINEPTISGTVYDAETGEPIVGAEVKVESDVYLTNGSGKYETKNYVAGSYTMSASKNGFVTITKTVTVDTNSSSTVDFSLKPEPGISGTVKNNMSDPPEAPLANAQMTIDGKTYLTDSTGSYTSRSFCK